MYRAEATGACRAGQVRWMSLHLLLFDRRACIPKQGGRRYSVPSCSELRLNGGLAAAVARLCLSFPRHLHPPSHAKLSPPVQLETFVYCEPIRRVSLHSFTSPNWRRNRSKPGTAALVVVVSRSSRSPHHCCLVKTYLQLTRSSVLRTRRPQPSESTSAVLRPHSNCPPRRRSSTSHRNRHIVSLISSQRFRQ